MSEGQETPGERIARARRRRGLSQAVLAGLVGRSESWLSQVERGRRGVDSHAVLTRMAGVLRVDVEELTGPASDGGEGQHMYEPAAAIEQAMMRYEALGASIGGRDRGTAGGADHLRAMASTVYQGYQATRYDDTGRVLPALIREAEAASREAGLDNPAMCEVRVLVYDTAAALLNRVGEPVLAWTAADRAMSAAEQSGQPVLAALCAWRLSYVIGSRNHPHEALELAMTAAAALERTMRAPDADTLSVYGALHLAAATAAAAAYDRAMTASLLGKAREIANRTGEGNRMGTAFGPANVSIHSMRARDRDLSAGLEPEHHPDPVADGQAHADRGGCHGRYRGVQPPAGLVGGSHRPGRRARRQRLDPHRGPVRWTGHPLMPAARCLVP